MDSRKFGILFFIQGGVRISKYFIVNFNKDLGFVAHPSILDGVQNGNNLCAAPLQRALIGCLLK